MKKLFILILACTGLAIAANAQEALKGCKEGVYRQIRYKVGEKPTEDYPFQVYKVLYNNEDTQNTYLFHLDLFDIISQNKKISSFIIRDSSSEMQIVEANKKSFVNRWVCDMAHKTIRYGEVVDEHYSQRHKATDSYKNFKKIFTKKPKKNNWYHGVWKLQIDKAVIYKIYGNNHRITVTLANGTAQGRVDTFEIMKNGSTMEDGNPCYFSWSSPDSYQLSYYINGYIFYENYKRSSIEEFEKELIQTLGAKSM